MIEQKGVDAIPWKNRLHVIMSANAEWVVPASHDERRYAMFDVLPDKIGDFGYFRAIVDELRAGGLAAMLYDLLHARLGDWHPREIVASEALQQQKKRSLAPPQEWLLSLLQDGALPAAPSKLGSPTAVYASVLLDEARDHSPWPQWSRMKVSDLLEQWGCLRRRTEYGSLWQFPSLGDMRAAWVRKFGAWQWGEGPEDWIMRK